MEAATKQADYLISKAKKFHINATHSTISHREDYAELWGDSIFMAPPFLAYYGAVTNNVTYLKAAVSQCHLYADVLTTHITLGSGITCKGPWRHIVSDPPMLSTHECCTDPHVWLTSNAWAAAGMTRVLEILEKWRPPLTASVDNNAYQDFRSRSKAILAGQLLSMLQCIRQQDRSESGLLRNYLDGEASRSRAWAYGETAGTALVTSVVYRLAVLLPKEYSRKKEPWLAWAEGLRRSVVDHVDRDGKVGPVADVSHVPSEKTVGQTSEGQSMAVLMHSAWRDCVNERVCKHRPSWTKWKSSWWAKKLFAL
jgi:rhamnogalacturonyl hydrolase YesR